MNAAAAPPPPSSDEEDFEAALTAVGLKTVGNKKNWPHMKFLCSTHKDVLFMLLRAVDECKCTGELNANNCDYPKGNRWNGLYDHCFGGGSGRGLLAGRLPQLSSASKLKQKILEIWLYLKKEGLVVDKELVQIARRQEMHYEQTKANDKMAADKQKNSDAKLQEEMRTYQTGVGSLPPGAKGTVGAGRRQHSTNLKTNQPAAYSYANMMTGGAANDAIVIEDKTPPKAKAKKSSATTIQNNNLDEMTKLGKYIEKGIGKLLGVDDDNDDNDKVTVGSKRKRAIMKKQKLLEKAMEVYQKFPNDESKKKLDENMKKYMRLSDELEALVDEEEEE